jgi:hypothetical protein
MGPLYRDIKTKKKFRGRFLRSLVNLLDQDSHSNTTTTPAEPDFAQFIVENLLYLEYGVIEEVFYVIHTIDRILSSTGVTLLQTIEGSEMTESLAILAQRSIVLSLLVGLKQHLKTAYSLTEAKCRAFDPKKAGGAKDNKTAVRMRSVGVIEWTEIPYVDKKIEETWQAQEQLQAVYPLPTVLIKFAALMHRDEVAGSQEVGATSEDELQVSTSDSATVVGEDDPSASQGVGTPVKKVKKRKEGSEPGSAKKKQKKTASASQNDRM